MITEEWRDIAGFEGYQVSDMGQVRSRRKMGMGNFSDEYHLLKGYILKLRGGYTRMTLMRDGKDHYKSVHVLVLETFVGPRPKGCYGCHSNGDPSDNRLVNLRWDTPLANIADTLTHGRRYRGERHSFAKLTAETVRTIRRLYAEGESQHSMSRRLGFSQQSISDVLTGKTWKHVQDD